VNTEFPARTNGQDPGDDPFYNDIPIDVLGLSARAYNALARSGIKTVGQVAQLRYVEILQLRNVGENTALEIDTRIAQFVRKSTDYTGPPTSNSQRVVPNTEPVKEIILDDWQRKYAPLAADVASIAGLKLSRRVYNALYRAGYTNISRLASAPFDRLMNARVIGEKSIAEIEERLNARLMQVVADQARDAAAPTELPGSSRQAARAASARRIDAPDWLTPAEPMVHEMPARTLFIEWLASCLTGREQEIVTLRYGLQAERLTLAEIGQLQHVSRERIRQIEKWALRRLANRLSMIDLLASLFAAFLVEQGGIATVTEAAAWFVRVQDVEVQAGAAGAVELLCDLDERFVYLGRQRVLALANLPTKEIGQVWAFVANLLSEYMAPTPIRLLMASYHGTASYQSLAEGWPAETIVTADAFIDACIRSHPEFEAHEPGVVSLTKWANRIVDNIIVALRELGEPSHFTAVAEAVNKQLPDDRQTTTHNVHGHMGRYENIFVRVGHGIYGLVEWGKRKDDSVVETAVRFLRETNQPQHISAITEYVLQSWQINPATVYPALHDESYYRDSTRGDLCLLLGEGVFTLSEWEEARTAVIEPVLSYCPPTLPDPPDFANALFESAIVAHERLRAAPRADVFLDGMFQWAQAPADQKGWLRQGVLNSYYLLGLVPYTYIFGGDNPHLRSTLPIGDIGAIRQACLSTLTRRLAFMPEFWGLLQTMQPVRQKELGEAFMPVRGDGLDDTAARLTLLAGLGAVVRGADYHFRLTKLGEQVARELGRNATTEDSRVNMPTVTETGTLGSDDLFGFAFWE
jgi:hypothetical protein